MRYLLLLLALALPLHADPPKVRTIKVGEKIIVNVNTDGDKITEIKFEEALVKIGDPQRVPGRFIYEIPITGVAKGETTVWVEATGYYTIAIQVVDDLPATVLTPAPTPVVEKVPLVPYKRIPVPIPEATPPPPPAPASPKKVSYPADRPVAKNVRTPNPFARRPSPVYQTTAAKPAPSPEFVTGRATTAQLAEGNSLCGTATSGPANTPIYALATGRSGGTGRAVGSG